MIHRVVLNGRMIDTCNDVVEKLDFGRTAAGFIQIYDLDGHNILVNVAHISAVIIDPPSRDLGDKITVGNLVSTVLEQMMGSVKPDEPIMIDDKGEDE